MHGLSGAVTELGDISARTVQLQALKSHPTAPAALPATLCPPPAEEGGICRARQRVWNALEMGCTKRLRSDKNGGGNSS